MSDTQNISEEQTNSVADKVKSLDIAKNVSIVSIIKALFLIRMLKSKSATPSPKKKSL